MSAIIVGRHVVDGNGEYRHMRGYRRDRRMPEGHDRLMAVSPAAVAALPSKLFSAQISHVPLLDQKGEGSCTGHAGVEALMHEESKKQPVVTRLSPQNLYKRTRMDEGTPLDEDSGAEVRDTIEAAHKFGVCREDLDPYSDNPEAYSAPITSEQAADALNHQLLLSVRCNNVQAVKIALSQGFSVQFGFTCFGGLMSKHAAQTGEVPYPEQGEKSVGGHSVLKVGWDDDYVINGEKGVFIFRQSWGEWGATYNGIKGYGLIPYRYMTTGLDGDNHSPRLVEIA